MITKNYLVIETNYDPVDVQAGKLYPSWHPTEPPIKARIKKGMLNKDIKECLSLATNWVPQRGDRVYFLPGSTVARFKVRMTGEKQKFSITIKPEYANAAFVSPKTLENTDGWFDQEKRMVRIDQEVVKTWLLENYHENHPLYVKIRSIMNNCEDEILIQDDSFGKLCYLDLKNKTNEYSKEITLNHFMKETGGHKVPKCSLYTPIAGSLLDNLKCPIYHQDEMLKLINKDSIVLDANHYKDLCLWFNSDDDDTVVTGMELISNCNFDESSLYLLLLIAQFHATFTKKGRKEANHVNFKGMLSYFDLTPKTLEAGPSMDHLFLALKKIGQATRQNIQRLTMAYGTPKIAGVDKFVTDHFQIGPVLKSTSETLLDNDFVSDSDELDLPEDDEDDSHPSNHLKLSYDRNKNN